MTRPGHTALINLSPRSTLLSPVVKTTCADAIAVGDAMPSGSDPAGTMKPASIVSLVRPHWRNRQSQRGTRFSYRVQSSPYRRASQGSSPTTTRR